MPTNIIIVDDSEDFRKGLKELLCDIPDAKVICEAEDGADLLIKINNNKPDLIFMDIEMPNVNGFEATKKVLSLYPDIKIIGMSGYDREKYIQKLIDVGAKGYLLKSGDNYDTINDLIQGKTKGFVFSPEIKNYKPVIKSDKTVLCVDKSDDRHLKFRHILRETGFRVLSAHNTDETILYLKKKKVDIVVLDASVLYRNGKIIYLISEMFSGKIFVIDNTTISMVKHEEKIYKLIIQYNDCSPDTFLNLLYNS